ncbi:MULTISPECIES: hypothetical protein [unclassified Arthrobacter]|uniref:hypothetical protein n=1 Tax=unclassified Arthrobacter TaxID=235627 RepID=UPI001C85B042|nr:hypothetical protein [Arthrobacter sp. MAHUQ-56]MBX7443370.1 hypothetical protein [Arthrobacter sp. MAHUQ-56]
MQLKPAAGLFVGGVTMCICGPILGTGAGFFANMALFRGDQQMAMVFWIVAALGVLLALIGFFVLVAAAHRALIKIDALPTGATAQHRQHWPSDR